MILSRRQALRLVGLGAGFGFIASGRVGGLVGAVYQANPGPAANTLGLPRGAIIRTLLKDVPPEALGNGATLVHEHLSLVNWRDRPPRQPRFFENVDRIVQEVREAGKDGISCIVDCGHPEMGRSLAALKRIAAETNVHIVGGAGHYTSESFPAELSRMSDGQLADEMVAEATSGHLGVFGEIGSSETITPDERKVFRAVAKAHVRTGLPIITHTFNGAGNTGKTPLEQLDILEAGGVNPRHVLIGHLDGLDMPAVHSAVAKRGAFCGFDRVGFERADRPWESTTTRVRNILKLLDAGYVDHLILSSDFSAEENLKSAGGPGIALTLTQFVPKLRHAGVKEEILHKTMVDNPRRLIAFVPAKG